MATYAANFDGYTGERFETSGAKENRSGLMVKTELVAQDGGRIAFDYLLRNGKGVWQIINVIADGVSDLSLKRADYTAVIKSEGFDSLITELNGKIAAYESRG